VAVNHKSGRIVVDIEPELKMALHAVLALRGTSLKQWFTSVAADLVAEHWQPRLTVGDALQLAENVDSGGHGADSKSGAME
jgi:hypothetical protein